MTINIKTALSKDLHSWRKRGRGCIVDSNLNLAGDYDILQLHKRQAQHHYKLYIERLSTDKK